MPVKTSSDSSTWPTTMGLRRMRSCVTSLTSSLWMRVLGNAIHSSRALAKATRQHAEGGAPAECIRDQHADGNAEHRRRHDAEGHQRDGAAGARRADQLDSGGAGQRPEHGQRQRGHEARHGHDPDVGRGHGQRIGQAEQDQHADEQALALDVGHQRRQQRSGGGDREGEQRDQQAGLGHGDVRSRARSGSRPTIRNSVVRMVKPAAESSRMGNSIGIPQARACRAVDGRC